MTDEAAQIGLVFGMGAAFLAGGLADRFGGNAGEVLGIAFLVGAAVLVVVTAGLSLLAKWGEK